MKFSFDVCFSISAIKIYGENTKERQVTWVSLQSGRILKQNNTAPYVFGQKSQSALDQPLSRRREEAALTRTHFIKEAWNKKVFQNKTSGLIVWIPRHDADEDNVVEPQEFLAIALIAFWWQFSLQEWDGLSSSPLSGHLAVRSAGGKRHAEWIHGRCQIPTRAFQRTPIRAHIQNVKWD